MISYSVHVFSLLKLYACLPTYKVELVSKLHPLLFSECSSPEQWDHLWQRFWLWLLWFQNYSKVLFVEDWWKGCGKATAHVNEGLCWNPQGWYQLCSWNVSFDISAMVHYSCLSYPFQCRNPKSPSMNLLVDKFCYGSFSIFIYIILFHVVAVRWWFSYSEGVCYK